MVARPSKMGTVRARVLWATVGDVDDKMKCKVVTLKKDPVV